MVDNTLNEDNEEVQPIVQQTRDTENDFPQDQAPAEVENNFAAPTCLKPKRVHSKHINCIHCGCAFHIQCVGFTERRAVNESYICTKCERML